MIEWCQVEAALEVARKKHRYLNSIIGLGVLTKLLLVILKGQ
jgi:hypothetical protein